jgi:hypothetical protein
MHVVPKQRMIAKGRVSATRQLLTQNVTRSPLTYMATLTKLVAAGVVVRINVELDGKLTWRELYAYPAGGQPHYAIDWITETLPKLASSAIGAEDTPEEQLYGLLALYATGERLNLGEMYKPLQPHAAGVWELRTVDVRIFGWFHRRDCFIAVFADETERCHKHRLHAGYRREVVRLRDAIDLDIPKFIVGVHEDDVLSIRA